MTINALGCLALVGTFVAGVFLNMASKEAETWVGALPLLLLKLARARVRSACRDLLYEEWAAELYEATHKYSERPISGLWFGTRYAAGILRAANKIGRSLGTARNPSPSAGKARPDSAAEQALEQALSKMSWAFGRRWNQTYQQRAGAVPLMVDLWWPDERCVVEIDGPEHRASAHFANDRRRDVQLQLDGQAVLRFTNEQVLADPGRAVAAIKQIVCARRST